MTTEELRAAYAVAYKIIMRERAWRDKVFSNNLDNRELKMAEMDKLLEIVDDMKNALKEYISADPQQATLIEVVKRTEYR